MANGTVTMEVALKALGVGWGDEVIIPALTFAATPTRPWPRARSPSSSTSSPSAGRSTPTWSRRPITPRTRAIMPVHLGQQMADMDRIMEIARRHDLFVVEDCAHAHGQRWRDQGAGSSATSARSATSPPRS